VSDIAISVENLGKKYHISGRQERYNRLTETVMDTLSAPIRRLRNLGKPAPPEEIIWALKDVSFEVKRGEVLGIIGRNGAGKTTLLKILSRITEPTEGRAEIHGRVGSLLEVGTGFHSELTGRENVYLNGAILGMKRTEIDRKFDEIVAFSEIERFLDTPVKRYSSGMRVRLAFAVAAHLEPEIMLVDEVLAVGDAQFQKKCLGKMGEVAREGRTVLFVSHNMWAINELCSRAILLRNGSIANEGSPQDMIEGYLASTVNLTEMEVADRADRAGTGRLRFTCVRLLVDGREVRCIESGRDVTIESYYEASEAMQPHSIRFGISILTLTGIKFVAFDSASTDFHAESIPRRGVVRCHIPRFPLVRGIYRGLLYAGINGEMADRVEDAFEFEVISSEYPRVGYVAVDHQWDLAPAISGKEYHAASQSGH